MSDELRVSQEKLREAVQEYASLMAQRDGQTRALTVSASVVMWETAEYGDDGDILYRTGYCFPVELSMSSAIGVVHLGVDKIEQDIMASREED